MGGRLASGADHHDVTIALFTLRREAACRPELAAPLALFPYAIEGLLFDQLTVSIDPETSTDDVVDALAERLLSGIPPMP